MTRVLLVLVLAFTACSDGRGGGDESAGDPTSTTATPASGPAVGPACEGPPIGDAVGEAATIDTADVDGDAAPDVATSYLAAETWRLRVDFADGGASEVTLTTPPTANAHLVAATDLDGDGREELWAVVGNGASAMIVGLYGLHGCELEAVRLEGTEAQFAVGGPVLLLQGVRCDDRRVVHLGATSDDGESFATLDLVYELRDDELVRVDDASGQLSSGDPALQAYSSFDC